MPLVFTVGLPEDHVCFTPMVQRKVSPPFQSVWKTTPDKYMLGMEVVLRLSMHWSGAEAGLDDKITACRERTRCFAPEGVTGELRARGWEHGHGKGVHHALQASQLCAIC